MCSHVGSDVGNLVLFGRSSLFEGRQFVLGKLGTFLGHTLHDKRMHWQQCRLLPC